MQGHKRTARPERHAQEGRDGALNTPLSTKLGTLSIHGEVDEDDGYDNAMDENNNSNINNGAGDGGRESSRNHSANHNNATRGLLDTSSALDQQVIYRNLWLFIWLKTIGSFDSGAFSAALGAENGIGDTWQLSMKQQGVLTSSVFLGNVIGCPLAGNLFSRCDEKRVLCYALIIHTFFTFTFAAMPSLAAALVNRFFIGLTLSFIVVYTPVWVDEFAPKNRQSVWMASHNAGVPLGVMLGYVLAVGPPLVFKSIGWNWSFFLKCLLMLPTIAYVARVDSRTINTVRTAADAEKDGQAERAGEDGGRGNNGAAAADSARSPATQTFAAASGASAVTPTSAGAAAGGAAGAASSSPSVFRSSVRSFVTHWTSSLSELVNRCLRTPIGDVPGIVLARCRYSLSGFVSVMLPLFTNGVYMCSVVSLTSLYFVATGLQNFVTQYLQLPPFNASMVTIMIGFGSAVVTAPVCGVIAGGILLDRIGGYKRNLRRVTLFLLFWASCAVLFSIICIFANTTRGFLLVMSVVLFCGGALIPPGAGLTMASLPDHLRSTGAAFSQTVYNLLGNFSGPMVCGWVAEVSGELRYGIIALLLSSALGVLPLLGIMCIAYGGGPLPSGLAAGGLTNGDDFDAAAVASPQLMAAAEEAYEMTSVAGEDGDGDEAAVPSYSANAPLSGGPDGPLKGEAPPQSSPRELVAFPSSAVVSTEESRRDVARASRDAAAPLPNVDERRPLATSTPSAVSALSPPAKPQPQPHDDPRTSSASAAVTGVARAWGSGRPALQGPGTAHPVMVPSNTTTTTPAAAAAPATSLPREGALAQRGPPAAQALSSAADLELLTLESEAAQVTSQPSEQPYGMDLVRSWLSTQQQNGTADGGGVVAAGNGTELATTTSSPNGKSLLRSATSLNKQ